jgi:predicted transcriptional regulator
LTGLFDGQSSEETRLDDLSAARIGLCQRVTMRHMSHMTALTRREREIMNAVFALGNRATADAIRARLIDPPSDSSVRVMLARLEKKGYLRHQEDGLRYVYSAKTSPAAAKRSALRQ